MTDEEQFLIDKYKLIFDLWKSENPIKTNKLQVLMATNSILASAFLLTGKSFWIALVGFFFSAVWIFSIGRAIYYQQHWYSLLEDIRTKDSNNIMFQTHSTKLKPPIWGSIPSKYYLVGTPIATTVCWLFIFFTHVN